MLTSGVLVVHSRVDDCFHDLSRDRSVLHQIEKTQLKDEKNLVEVKLDMERMNRSVLDELACTRGELARTRDELARALSQIASLTQDHKNLLVILAQKGFILIERGLELMIWAKTPNIKPRMRSHPRWQF